MKPKIVTLLLALACITIGCTRDDDVPRRFESTAVISGFDMTFCGCCGGWVITIDEQHFANRFSELPEGSDIDLRNATFPLNVQLNWSESEEYCGNGITVESSTLVE